jgi:hypothetical protein
VLVVGEEPAKCVTRYKQCDKMQELLTWWVPDWQKYLHGNYLKGPAIGKAV